MPSNIEIKARLLDKELALCIAKELSHSEGRYSNCDVVAIICWWYKFYNYFANLQVQF